MSSMSKDEAVLCLALPKTYSEAKRKAARGLILPGDLEFDATVRVVGEMKVGADHTRRQETSADPWALLAEALTFMGSQTHASQDELLKLIMGDHNKRSRAQRAARAGRVQAEAKGLYKATNPPEDIPVKGRVSVKALVQIEKSEVR
jgi:hypothetical protein